MKKTTLGIILALIAVAIVVGVVVASQSGDDSNDAVDTTVDTSRTDTNSVAENGSNATEQEPRPEQDQGQEDAAAASEVVIQNMAYQPAEITVKKGTTVTWVNQDSVQHTVTSDSGNTLDSGLLSQGESFSYTFNETGTFAYHCVPHPHMRGTVTVVD